MQDLEIIGIDVGDGESCIAIGGLKEAPLQMVDVQGDKRVITAVADHPARGTLIGADAVTSSGVRDLRVRFKRYGPHDPRAIGPTRRFVSALLASATGDSLLRVGDHSRFFVGCPSGWGADRREAYRATMEEAGLKGAEILPESRAAFLYARESDLHISDERLKQRVVVVDIGSSTTDITIVHHLTATPVDVGHALGAGFIEELILDRFVALSPMRIAIEDAFRSSPWLRSRAEIFCRDLKERYFSLEDRWRTEALVEAYRVPTNPPVYLEVALDAGVMGEILRAPIASLDGISWSEEFRRLLKLTRESMKGESAGLILLTGGGSRMRFVREACGEVFPEAVLDVDKEPEFAIARGLAYAGRIAHKIAPFRMDVDNLCRSDAIASRLKASAEKLRNEIAERISEPLIHAAIVPAVAAWRDGRVAKLRDMQSHVAPRAEAWLRSTEGSSAIQAAVEEWRGFVAQDLRALTDPICTQYGLPASALDVFAHYAVKEVSGIQGANLSQISLLDNVAAVVGVVGSLVIASLLGGGGTALLMSGPLGWVIGLVVGIVAMFFVIGAADEVELPVWVRQLVDLKSLPAKVKDDVSAGVKKALEQDGGQLDTLIAETATRIRATLMKIADDAELYIR